MSIIPEEHFCQVVDPYIITCTTETVLSEVIGMTNEENGNMGISVYQRIKKDVM